MYALGKAFLAHAGLAAEQDRGAPLRKMRDLLEDVAHDFRLRHEGVVFAFLRHGGVGRALDGQTALAAEVFLKIGGLVGDHGGGHFQE